MTVFHGANGDNRNSCAHDVPYWQTMFSATWSIFFFSEYWKDQALLRNGFRAQFCVLYELKIVDNSMSEFASV